MKTPSIRIPSIALAMVALLGCRTDGPADDGHASGKARPQEPVPPEEEECTTRLPVNAKDFAAAAENLCMPQEFKKPPCQQLCPETRRVGPCEAAGTAGKRWRVGAVIDDAEGSAAVQQGGKDAAEHGPPGKGKAHGGRPTPGSASADLLAALDDYCEFEWTDPKEPPSRDDLPKGSVPNCQIDVAMAPPVGGGGSLTTVPEVDTNALETDFLTSIGSAEPGVAATTTSVAGSRAPVMVAVVDTADGSTPTTTPSNRDFHGRAMAWVVGKAACPGSTCDVLVEPILGLPMRAAGSAGIHAGYGGTQADLAQGIYDAVKAWDHEKATRGQDFPLIINLSVGWELECDASPKSGPVRVALEKAQEHGVLVLAAAGNLPIGGCGLTGPTAPAAWEPDGTPPFVYAVTPVDDQLDDLADHRPGSNARLAARGFQAIYQQRALSGSSVSTAVVSGIAARLWVENPSLTPAQVVERLYTSGVTRSVNASTVMTDPPFGSPPSEQHVVTGCGAVACGRTWNASSSSCDTSSCPKTATVASSSPWSDVIEDAKAKCFESDGTVKSDCVQNPVTFEVECPGCDGESIPTAGTGAFWVNAHGNPWVSPQPDVPICSVCTITDDLGLLQLDEGYGELTVDRTIITLWNASGDREIHIYQELPLNETEWFSLVNEEFIKVNGQLATKGYITITFTDPPGYPTGNEITVSHN